MFGPPRPYGPYRPVVNLADEREKYIKEDKPAIFQIADRRLPANAGKRVTMQSLKEEAKNVLRNFSIPYAGKIAVQKHNKSILKNSEKHNIDPDIIRAVMYAENTRGWYGKPAEALNWSDSILPMNIKKQKWARLVNKKQEDMHDADINIEAGTVLLKRIRDRIERPTPEKIGSIWHYSGMENIDEFGNYVGEVYKKKPWLGSGD